ncbi:hypothetical protein C6495_14090 [Candidatus Poribacteria bacterium]|nr:MAG: hypothetical protein C6495_14090 [Candidatus Poribacteria bacterium]
MEVGAVFNRAFFIVRAWHARLQEFLGVGAIFNRAFYVVRAWHARLRKAIFLVLKSSQFD